MCVSDYLTVPKFWLLTLKFLEQGKYSFHVSERFLFQSGYTASVCSRVPSEYIQQIQLLTIWPLWSYSSFHKVKLHIQ